MQRRDFIKGVASGTAAALVPGVGEAARNRPSLRFLRPPGALAEDDFLGRCINCGKCGEACPNRCIKYFGFENGLSSIDTPYIIAREKGCILCMKCGDACPTGAITMERYQFAESRAEAPGSGKA